MACSCEKTESIVIKINLRLTMKQQNIMTSGNEKKPSSSLYIPSASLDCLDRISKNTLPSPLTEYIFPHSFSFSDRFL